jgi:hypothetical protein
MFKCQECGKRYNRPVSRCRCGGVDIDIDPSGQRAAGSGQRAAGSGQRAAGSGQRAAGSGCQLFQQFQL